MDILNEEEFSEEYRAYIYDDKNKVSFPEFCDRAQGLVAKDLKRMVPDERVLSASDLFNRSLRIFLQLDSAANPAYVLHHGTVFWTLRTPYEWSEILMQSHTAMAAEQVMRELGGLFTRSGPSKN